MVGIWLGAPKTNSNTRSRVSPSIARLATVRNVCTLRASTTARSTARSSKACTSHQTSTAPSRSAAIQAIDCRIRCRTMRCCKRPAHSTSHRPRRAACRCPACLAGLSGPAPAHARAPFWPACPWRRSRPRLHSTAQRRWPPRPHSHPRSLSQPLSTAACSASYCAVNDAIVRVRLRRACCDRIPAASLIEPRVNPPGQRCIALLRDDGRLALAVGLRVVLLHGRLACRQLLLNLGRLSPLARCRSSLASLLSSVSICSRALATS